jgi:hypothetical protein
MQSRNGDGSPVSSGPLRFAIDSSSGRFELQPGVDYLFIADQAGGVRCLSLPPNCTIDGLSNLVTSRVIENGGPLVPTPPLDTAGIPRLFLLPKALRNPTSALDRLVTHRAAGRIEWVPPPPNTEYAIVARLQTNDPEDSSRREWSISGRYSPEKAKDLLAVKILSEITADGVTPKEYLILNESFQSEHIPLGSLLPAADASFLRFLRRSVGSDALEPDEALRIPRALALALCCRVDRSGAFDFLTSPTLLDSAKGWLNLTAPPRILDLLLFWFYSTQMLLNHTDVTIATAVARGMSLDSELFCGGSVTHVGVKQLQDEISCYLVKTGSVLKEVIVPSIITALK